MSQPLVIVPDQLAGAPRIVRTQENRVAIGAGGIAYATGITKERGLNWQIFRPGAALVDPQTKETLGQEATYLGEATVTKFGEVSTLEIVKSQQEIYSGDYLLPAPRETLLNSYAPHAPGKKIDAQIIATYGALFETGNNGIVAINKGARDGLEVGNVLAIYRNLNASTYRLRESSLYGRQGFIYDENAPTRNYVNEPLVTRNSPLYGRIGPMGGAIQERQIGAAVGQSARRTLRADAGVPCVRSRVLCVDHECATPRQRPRHRDQPLAGSGGGRGARPLRRK